MIISLSHQTLWNFSVSTFLKVAAQHFQGVELVDEPRMHTWELKDNLPRIKDQLSPLSLRVTLHATYRDLNLASSIPEIRRLSQDMVKGSIDRAAELEAKVVTIHPGHRSGRKVDRGDAIMFLVEGLQEICSYAEAVGIPVAIENMAASKKKLCQSPQELLRILEKVGSPNLGVTTDFSHVAMMNLSPKRFVEVIQKHLFNVHISDFEAGTDHLHLGRGLMNMEEIFQELNRIKYKGSCVLEAWYAQDPLKGLLSSTKKIAEIQETLKPKAKPSARK